MAPVIFALVAIAAVMHAAWNALLKGSEEPLDVAVRALVSSTLVITPLVFLAWLLTGRPGMPARGWLLGIASGALEVVYFYLLSMAYRRGALSVVYPIARGTAPLLAVVIGLVFLQERSTAAGLAGVACLLVGIWAVRRPVGRNPAVLPALATGVVIAGYSAVDRVGVRLGPAWLYGYTLWVTAAVLLPLVAWARRKAFAGDLANGAPDWGRALAVGLLMTAAFYLILLAFQRAPLIIVSPLRESAIVLVTLWGVFRLREREGAWLKLGGSALIVAGGVLVALA
jgi:drug/metabolite transporter (DMT)-like permease